MHNYRIQSPQKYQKGNPQQIQTTDVQMFSPLETGTAVKSNAYNKLKMAIQLRVVVNIFTTDILSDQE